MSRFERLPPLARAAVVAGVVLGAFVILFAVAELTVRVRAYAKYGSVQSVNELFHIDKKLGIRVPNPNTNVMLARTHHVQINNWGFRSPPISIDKPPHTIRVAFLGESTTFGAEASSNEMTWAHLVTSKLQKDFPEVRFEYINAAVSGFIVRDSLIRFENQVRPFSPDIVIVYHGNNDLSISSRAVAVRQQLINPNGLEDEAGLLSPHSQLLFLIEKNLQYRARQSQGEGQSRKLSNDFDFRPLAEEFQDHMQELVGAIERSGAIPVLVTFSARVRPTQTPAQQLEAVRSNFQVMPYMTPALLLRGYATFNDAIRRLAATDPRVILVGDEFAIPSSSDTYQDAIHLRDPGMVAMSDRVVRILAGDERVATLVHTRMVAPAIASRPTALAPAGAQ